MAFDLKKHLKTLCEIAAPSGHEGPVYDALREVWVGYVDEMKTDGLGNLIAIRYGSGPEPRRRLMLTAHMDEIGLMVSEVCEGFILTETLGGIDYRPLLMQPVWVHGQQKLRGIFAAAPPHMTLNRKNYPSGDELWIDVGLPADEVTSLVQVGDLVTFDAPPLELKGERLVSKSLDNRASVAVLTACLDELSRRQHAWDVAVVATVMEERGRQGAISAAFQTMPDLALAIDATFALQPGVSDDDGFALGSGPTIGRGPNFHPLLFKHLRDLAKAEDIKYQIEALPSDSGTDAWPIQVSRMGVPTALLSIPLRNMHTPVEMIDMSDLRWTLRLATAFITGLEPDFLETIAWPREEDES